MAPSAAPPSPQEISRQLSVHSVPKSAKVAAGNTNASGVESDSEIHVLDAAGGSGLSGSSSLATAQPLTAIAERPDVSGGDDSEEDEEELEEGGWKSHTPIDSNSNANAKEVGVLKAGYLWKKGERRKTWKKRWFVLRPTHLAYYKTEAEYQLLRLLELSDVHSCTKISLKKHDNTFGLVSPVRTFYLQARTPEEVTEWVKAIEEARYNFLATSTQNSQNSAPIPIPGRNAGSASSNNLQPPLTPSPPSQHPSYVQALSSDSDGASPDERFTVTTGSGGNSLTKTTSTSPGRFPQTQVQGGQAQTVAAAKDPGKTVLSGYLMKCGSKRRNWRKRWFVLTGEKLMYSASHMDTKPHRQFAFSEILDAIEVDLPSTSLKAHHPNLPPASPGGHRSLGGTLGLGSDGYGFGHGHGGAGAGGGGGDGTSQEGAHTFKIITTKRTLLLCAPGEEEEIKWLGAVRALMARRSNLGNESVGGVAVARSPGGGGGSSSVNTASTLTHTTVHSTMDTSPSSSGFASSNGASSAGGGGSGGGGGGVVGNGSKSSKKRISASHGISAGGTALSSNVIIEEEVGSLSGHGGRS